MAANKPTLSVEDEESITKKQLKDYQVLQEMKDRFNLTWLKAEDNERFSKYCYDLGMPREHQMYLVASMMDGGGWTQTERCKVIGIQFNRRHHRHYHDDSRNADVISYAKRCLDMAISPKDRSITKVLESIIHGEARPTDKVKAIESYVKIQEKERGSNVLKPWEKMWLDTMIPALHSIYCSDNTLDQ